MQSCSLPKQDDDAERRSAGVKGGFPPHSMNMLRECMKKHKKRMHADANGSMQKRSVGFLCTGHMESETQSLTVCAKLCILSHHVFRAME